MRDVEQWLDSEDGPRDVVGHFPPICVTQSTGVFCGITKVCLTKQSTSLNRLTANPVAVSSCHLCSPRPVVRVKDVPCPLIPF